MNQPQWILAPWAGFAFALAPKLWQLGRALKGQLMGASPSTDQFSQSLDRTRVQAREEAKWRA